MSPLRGEHGGERPAPRSGILGGFDPAFLAVAGSLAVLALLGVLAYIGAPGAEPLLVSIVAFIVLVVLGGKIHRR